MRPDELVAELIAERAALFEVLSGVEPASMTTSGLLGAWSGREMIAHLGYWAGRATEAIHEAELGFRDEDDLEGPDVDAVNETVARVARHTDLATVRRREAASVDALVERLKAVDPGLLTAVGPDGGTVEETVREDGALHYREHADELRAALGRSPHA